MSIPDTGVVVAIVLGIVGFPFAVAAFVFGWRNDRALRRVQEREQAADEFDEVVHDYADHVIDGLRPHVNSGNLYPEYAVESRDRRLAHAAVQRGLLSAGTRSGQVTLPGRAATPTISAVGLYHRS